MTVDVIAPTAVPEPGDAAHEVWGWVLAAQQGDSDAFGRIYDRYVDSIFRFIYFRVGNRPLAEDLTSDAFLRAFKRIHSFTWQGRDLGAWLVTIARNLVADHFKSGRYRLEVTTGDVLDADREDRGPEGSPESAVVDHITNVALLTALKQLTPEQQECLILRYLRGFSVAETAAQMGKNEGAIKALQYRAVRALARQLELADPADPSAGFVAIVQPDPPPPAPIVWTIPEPRTWEPTDDVVPEADFSPRAIRAWAAVNKIHVGCRGLVPAHVRTRYAEAMTAGRR